MSRFVAKHPEISLRITTNVWDSVLDDSADNDLEIRYGHGKWRGKKADRITRDELFPVCSPDYLANSPELTTPEDTIDHTLLHVFGWEEGWGYWISQTELGHTEITQHLQFDNSAIALEMAARGLGLALGRTCLVAEMIESGRLVAPLEKRIPTEEAFYLVYAASKLNHPQAASFRDWLLEEIANDEPNESIS